MLYLTDRAGDRLLAIDLRTGDLRRAHTRADPVGVVTDDQGRIYVAAFSANTVHRYQPDTLARTRSWKPGFGDDLAPVDEAGPPSRGWDPRGLAYDAVRDHLVVSHHFVNRVSLVDLQSEAVIDAVFGEVQVDAEPGHSQGIPYGFGSMAMGAERAAWARAAAGSSSTSRPTTPATPARDTAA